MFDNLNIFLLGSLLSLGVTSLTTNGSAFAQEQKSNNWTRIGGIIQLENEEDYLFVGVRSITQKLGLIRSQNAEHASDQVSPLGAPFPRVQFFYIKDLLLTTMTDQRDSAFFSKLILSLFSERSTTTAISRKQYDLLIYQLSYSLRSQQTNSGPVSRSSLPTKEFVKKTRKPPKLSALGDKIIQVDAGLSVLSSPYKLPVFLPTVSISTDFIGDDNRLNCIDLRAGATTQFNYTGTFTAVDSELEELEFGAVLMASSNPLISGGGAGLSLFLKPDQPFEHATLSICPAHYGTTESWILQSHGPSFFNHFESIEAYNPSLVLSGSLTLLGRNQETPIMYLSFGSEAQSIATTGDENPNASGYYYSLNGSVAWGISKNFVLSLFAQYDKLFLKQNENIGAEEKWTSPIVTAQCQQLGVSLKFVSNNNNKRKQ